MMRRIALFLLLGLWWPMYAVAQTAGSPYDVEVVVFEINAPDLEGSELWTADKVQPSNVSGATTIGSTPTASPLSNAATALQASNGRYRVLLHKRWTQALDEKDKTKAVLLNTDDHALNGTLKFYVSRFLHLELNLDYSPAPLVSVAGQMTPIYQIKEQRRVKSQETHYFDHPKFGAIVRVAPAAPN